MEQDKFSSRRIYSAQFRALVLKQCAPFGASVAKVALSHGMNANVVHRWRREAGDSAASVGLREFVPVSVAAPEGAWKFGAKTERMNAEQRSIFEVT